MFWFIEFAKMKQMGYAFYFNFKTQTAKHENQEVNVVFIYISLSTEIK